MLTKQSWHLLTTHSSATAIIEHICDFKPGREYGEQNFMRNFLYIQPLPPQNEFGSSAYAFLWGLCEMQWLYQKLKMQCYSSQLFRLVLYGEVAATVAIINPWSACCCSEDYCSWLVCVCVSVCPRLFWHCRLRGGLWAIQEASEQWDLQK